MNVSVVMPVFNEEKTILKVIKKVFRQKNIYELIIVNDASIDNSKNIIEKVRSKKIRLINHIKNQGKGRAIITGVHKAKGDVVIIQDGDLELDPKDYKHVLKPLQTNEADFVIGNRWQRYRSYSLTRLGNIFLTTFFNFLFWTNLHDLYCCYKAAKLKTWKKLKLSSKNFEIEAEIMSKVFLQHLKVEEVPVSYRPRKYKEGKKIKATDAFIGAFTILKCRI